VPPTALEMKRMRRARDCDVFTEEQGWQGQDAQEVSELPRDLMPGVFLLRRKMAAGGYTHAADGCASGARLAGKMV
jgi:hypothetical protein